MKVLIVDDHVIVSRYLRSIVEAEFVGVSCIDVQDGESCISNIKKGVRFDLVILDISLPDMDGITLASWILGRNPAQKILFFSTSAQEIYYERLRSMGVSGFVGKQSEVGEIARALHLIIEDNRSYFAQVDNGNQHAVDQDPGAQNPFSALSRRELSVAQMLALGRTLPEISLGMGIEPSTIRTYKSRIYKRLGVSNMNDFIKLAQSHNLI
jgi:two-component system invasion response regulator UvrY